MHDKKTGEIPSRQRQARGLFKCGFGIVSPLQKLRIYLQDSDSDFLSDCSNRPDQPDVLDTNDIIINLDSERYLKTFVNRLADTGELQRLAKYLTKHEEEALVGLINDTPNR